MKVLFLCNANMCRSPLAEGLLKLIFKEKNIDGFVDSAGFEAYHINETPYEHTIRKAQNQGIDISTKRVRLFSQTDFDKFDRIYVMDTLAYRNAIEFARNDEDKAKVDFLMNVVNPGKNEPVPVPHAQSEDDYDQTYMLLHEACEKIAESITKEQLI